MNYQVKNLSGGNKQKLNLSVAILPDPAVLMLDELYQGFDWNTYLKFWELTEELAEKGRSVLIISHLIEEKENLDRLYELCGKNKTIRLGK